VDLIALYYPYIHVRDGTWLKYAALYWPQLGRLRPPGYPTRDSAVTRRLQQDLGWIVDVAPERAAEQVKTSFLELIEEHAPSLRSRFGIDGIDGWPNRPGHGSLDNVGQVGWSGGGATSAGAGTSAAPDLDIRLGYVHVSKVHLRLSLQIVESGLGILRAGRGGHPELANVYMCALTEQVAAQNRLHPVTDQALPHSAVSGWTVERLAEVLLGERFSDAGQSRSGDVLQAFALTSVETVVPADLPSVPVDKIVEVRARFGPELDAFREYVTSQVAQLSKIEDVQELTVFQEYVRNEVQHTVARELAELRERLRSVGLESAKALVNIKPVALPPLLAGAANLVGVNPVVTGAAGVATCLAAVPLQAREQRRELVRQSPVGYLFRIGRELNPEGLSKTVRNLLKRS
jgi:hypothetical protein